jgi:hypothetical protein
MSNQKFGVTGMTFFIVCFGIAQCFGVYSTHVHRRRLGQSVYAMGDSGEKKSRWSNARVAPADMFTHMTKMP